MPLALHLLQTSSNYIYIYLNRYEFMYHDNIPILHILHPEFSSQPSYNGLYQVFETINRHAVQMIGQFPECLHQQFLGIILTQNAILRMSLDTTCSLKNHQNCLTDLNWMLNWRHWLPRFHSNSHLKFRQMPGHRQLEDVLRPTALQPLQPLQQVTCDVCFSGCPFGAKKYYK